jgi:hypothetical protein
MKTTFTRPTANSSFVNRTIMQAAEIAILFLLLLGTMNLFAQTTEPKATDSNTLQFVKQTMVYNSGKVYLNWVVPANSNDCVYVVERSIDGDEYEPVGLKEGIGSPIELLYSWIDNQPKDGQSFYRIKQINMEGKMMAKSDQWEMNTPQNPLFLDKGTRLVQVK